MKKKVTYAHLKVYCMAMAQYRDNDKLLSKLFYRLNEAALA